LQAIDGGAADFCLEVGSRQRTAPILRGITCSYALDDMPVSARLNLALPDRLILRIRVPDLCCSLPSPATRRRKVMKTRVNSLASRAPSPWRLHAYIRHNGVAPGNL